jgi:hypothetical protein
MIAMFLSGGYLGYALSQSLFSAVYESRVTPPADGPRRRAPFNGINNIAAVAKGNRILPLGLAAALRVRSRKA